MSALTKNEREGLEDVFLSIHTSQKKYEKLKNISSLIMSHVTTINALELLKQAKSGIKSTKISHYLVDLIQKKKNLSK
ncbi:MAG: hypothetical protein JXQ67_06100 [Campylobacterales bacterium]|nr:hypothetical protein [Campylobacterales bacterium]